MMLNLVQAILCTYSEKYTFEKRFIALVSGLNVMFLLYIACDYNVDDPIQALFCQNVF